MSDLEPAAAARPVDLIAERYVEECIERYPEVATELGVPGHGHRWGDYSPDGYAERGAHLRDTLAELRRAVPVDERETRARDVMVERLGVELELLDAHETTSRVSVVDSFPQQIRGVFDLMPRDGEQAWADITSRLRTVDQPLAQVRQTLAAEADRGHRSAVRQVTAAAAQIRSWTAPTASRDVFAELVAELPADAPDSLRADLTAAAERARAAFADFGSWLDDELAPRSPDRDPVGAERYPLLSRSFLGTTLDLAETYAWGWDELARVQEEQRRIARQLVGSDDIAEAYAALDADPDRQIRGAEPFRRWMQELSDQAVADLAGTHFDIPEPIRTLQCCLAPTHDGLIYYTAPSEDFSRPGRMWWAVPEGVDTFGTWKEATTVYHEGVPGHHLQIAQNAYRSDVLNRWQRQLCFVSGHGEGWALYAERLMDDLGYLTDPGLQMGMLDAHAFRSARVVLDIGMHLELEIPRGNASRFHPGERWTPELGLEFLLATSSSDEATLRFERDRYLGWAGQAPAYKVGERAWLQARDEVRTRHGSDFDLRAFHARALDLGSVGLDALHAALAGF